MPLGYDGSFQSVDYREASISPKPNLDRVRADAQVILEETK